MNRQVAKSPRHRAAAAPAAIPPTAGGRIAAGASCRKSRLGDLATWRFIAVVATALSAGPSHAADLVFEKAQLQGLDKVSGRIVSIEAPVGQSVHFGTLELIVRTCRKRPPEEPPEAAAFIDIWEIRTSEPAVSLFRGWMFASSPALSALEHPVYDVWMVDCTESSSSAAPTSNPP